MPWTRHLLVVAALAATVAALGRPVHRTRPERTSPVVEGATASREAPPPPSPARAAPVVPRLVQALAALGAASSRRAGASAVDEEQEDPSGDEDQPAAAAPQPSLEAILDEVASSQGRGRQRALIAYLERARALSTIERSRAEQRLEAIFNERDW
jgi:hypothetical protein